MGLRPRHFAATINQRLQERIPAAVKVEMGLRAQRLGCPADVEPVIRQTLYGVEYRFDW